MNIRKQFKNILHDDELTNIDTVKEYLQYSFRQRKPKKDYKLYINICKIYDHYPETIKELLNNIPTLGYYKDYFYILMFSRNSNLDDYIYNIVVKQLKEDLQNLKLKKEISTLGKWLPREKCKINQKCGFIDKFNALFYPDITDKFTARRRYRKMKTMLNNKLGTLEAKMCTKKYEEIDFNKVSHMALKRNTESLMKHDECKIKLDEHETATLNKMTLSEFMKELVSETHPVDKMDKLWEHNRFRMEIPYIDKLMANSVCIIDLSKDTFSNNAEFFTIGMALLIDKFSTLDNKVIICNDNVMKLDGNILDKVKKLLQYVGPCRGIDVNKYYDLVMKFNPNNKCKNIVFVTTKKINDIESFSDKNITMLQYIPDYNSYDIVYYNGDKIRRFKKYEQKSYNDKNIELYESNKDIHNIIDDSDEFKDKFCIYLIMFLLFLLFVLRIDEYFYV